MEVTRAYPRIYNEAGCTFYTCLGAVLVLRPLSFCSIMIHCVTVARFLHIARRDRVSGQHSSQEVVYRTGGGGLGEASRAGRERIVRALPPALTRSGIVV